MTADMTHVEALRAFKQQYLDLYCRESGTPRDVAVVLFDELVESYGVLTKRRGLVRPTLARQVGVRDVSRLDKALRVLAQNLQLFGHRRTEWPEVLRTCTTSRLTPDPATLSLGVITSLCTYRVRGTEQVLEIAGPTAAARGDSDKGRYWLKASFRTLHPPMSVPEVLRAFADKEHLVRPEHEAVVIARLQSLLPKSRPRTEAEEAERDECIAALENLPAQEEELIRRIEARENYLATQSDAHPQIRDAFVGDIARIRGDLERIQRILAAAAEFTAADASVS